MKNIKFAYLYRDGGNYKCHGEIVFSNEENLEAVSVEAELKRAFTSDGMFIANQIRIPELFLYHTLGLTVDDHCFHEFCSVEQTAQNVNDRLGRSAKEFLTEVKREAVIGWRAFDPYERLQSEKIPYTEA